MSQLTFPTLAFSRPNWAEIDLGSLLHNASVLRARVAPAQVLAVIKADAYGHGAVPVALTLAESGLVSALAVASVDEAVLLRQEGVSLPILLLSAILPEEATDVVAHDLMATVWTLDLARALGSAAQRLKKTARAHFKVDTGMGRLGASLEQAAHSYRQILELPYLQICGVYSHLAGADENPDSLTSHQLASFNTVLAEIRPAQGVLRHVANSAAILRYPPAYYDLVRPGLSLYGVCPLPEGVEPPVTLKPVMTWKTRIASLKDVPAGHGVSYGATWKADVPTRVATLAVGYADGYPWSLSGKGQVLVRNVLCPVLGRVTMDQVVIGVDHLPFEVVPGQEVVLFGPELPVETVASQAGTIPWEMLCSLTKRVPRVYISPHKSQLK